MNSVVNCTDVRQCLSADQGAEYDPATGVISVCVSPDAGNSLTRDANGCLFVSPGNNAVVTGCGLDGTGTASDPLTIDGKAWPFACAQDSATATGVYCDPATGELHGDPPNRVGYFAEGENVILPGTGIVVPAAEATVRSLTLDVTNPDPCRPARVILWQDVDMDLDLPIGSGGGYGMDGDDLVYLANEGTGTVFSTHAQSGKTISATLAAGASATLTMNYTAGRGSGGAQIRRIQGTMRAWILSMP